MNEIKKLTDANPSLESQYKRESIIAKYKKIDLLERAKREVVKKLGSMLYKGVELHQLRLDDTSFSAHYTVKEKSLIKRMENEAKKANFTVSNVADGIKIEGKL